MSQNDEDDYDYPVSDESDRLVTKKDGTTGKTTQHLFRNISSVRGIEDRLKVKREEVKGRYGWTIDIGISHDEISDDEERLDVLLKRAEKMDRGCRRTYATG